MIKTYSVVISYQNENTDYKTTYSCKHSRAEQAIQEAAYMTNLIEKTGFEVTNVVIEFDYGVEA
jgi:hypothetical protein